MTGRLLPVLGLGFGIAVTIGNTIGAGIFRTPGEVAAHLPTESLFMAAWMLGGLYALLGAIQMAELATMLPRSGGQYVFSRYALGEYAGFIVGWPRAAGEALLHELTQRAQQPEFVLSHAWREGDAIVWDNRAVLHRATYYDPVKYKRFMQRTTIGGDVMTVPQ